MLAYPEITDSSIAQNSGFNDITGLNNDITSPTFKKEDPIFNIKSSPVKPIDPHEANTDIMPSTKKVEKYNSNWANPDPVFNVESKLGGWSRASMDKQTIIGTYFIHSESMQVFNCCFV